MVDKRKCASLREQRGGRYMKLSRSSSIAKRKSSRGLPPPSNGTPYKGVRMRVWGKWVTEIRDPVTKARIWLGSFATAEMAARAYDAAVVCLKGASAPEVNFPDSIPWFVVPQSHSSPKEIQAVALAAAKASVPAAAPLAMVAAPELPIPPGEECHEPLLDFTDDLEFSRDGSDAAVSNDDGPAHRDASDPDCSTSSNVENWILNELETLEEAPVDPLSKFLDLEELHPLFQWPILQGFDDEAADCSTMHDHDMQLWSFG